MNRSKQKGTAFESAVVACLQANGHRYAERRALQGTLDKGDVAGIPGVVLECKNQARMDLAGWMNEAELEAANAGVFVFAVVHKRRGRAAEDAYVTMPLTVFAELIR